MSKQAPAIPSVIDLSNAQLRAYNARDIDAFCACYHDDVVVLDERGDIRTEGIAAFREGYERLFTTHEIHAWITERISLPPHIIEKETWKRRHLETGEDSSGEVIVRYTERDGRIAIVAFLRPTT